MTSQTAAELYQAGDLFAAIEAATDAVRSSPQDLDSRALLCELLCVSGDYDRADKQLEATSKLFNETMMGTAMLRHMIRAALSRREVYTDGRVPEFLEVPSGALALRLEALTAARSGDGAGALELIGKALDEENGLTAVVNGNEVAEFRDLDDILGPTLEVFTATGKFYWIHLSQISELQFDKPESVTDLLWRSAAIETTGDVQGQIHIPATYHGSEFDDEIPLRLGRASDWREVPDGGPTRGFGQRMFLCGDDAATILEMQSIVRETDAADSDTPETD